MQRPVLFIDDGGVMNDNAVRGPQWQRLVGELFAPLLGGDPSAWAEANRVVATALWEGYRRTMTGRTDADFNAWLSGYRLAWTREMCAYVGVTVPTDEDCLDLYRRASTYVTARVHAAFLAAVDALRLLHNRGYTLHTASGEESEELHGYLTGMGVRHCFGRLYGPDLVNTPKEGAAYYERIFADAGVTPSDAVVIDDNRLPLGWAARTGARTVLVSADGQDTDGVDLVIGGLGELPAALDRF